MLLISFFFCVVYTGVLRQLRARPEMNVDSDEHVQSALGSRKYLAFVRDVETGKYSSFSECIPMVE